MKARTTLNSFLLVLISTFLFSCEELIEEIFDDPFMNAGTEVYTAPPEVNAERVIFKGSVSQVPRDMQVEYGFMWYRSDEENPDIQRMVIGRRTSSGSFEATAMNLPRGENLVVCAFVATTESVSNEVIGEERDFSWRL